ncbi:MAG: glycoside hydrolase family 127 protein [Abditibacteriota bacterium]|nr:glycoside hydrolase family 127 protein [Abditibacteriota bacterium]
MNKIHPLLRYPEAGAMHWDGVLGSTSRYIETRELKQRDLWAKFVNEFRVRRDGERNAWAGEFWGKMLRGACITWRYSGDPELYDVITGTVEDMLTTQDEQGRFSTYTPDTEFAGWDMWCRKYVLLAMEYYLDICRDEDLKARIIEALKKHADYIIDKVGPGEGRIPIVFTSNWWGGMNSCSILEPMVKLYALTGEKRYLDYCRYIIDAGGCAYGDIFAQALEDRTLPCDYGSDKAYEMISCFEGILEYYKLTGEERYLRMAENFFRAVRDTDVTVTGCCGTHGEQFNRSATNQTDPAMMGVMQENCVSVTWLKFAGKLLALTGKACYAEVMEQTAYNAFLSAVNLPEEEQPFDTYGALLLSHRGKSRGGWQPLAAGGGYGCCQCIGSAASGLMPLSAVMWNDTGVYVSFYEQGAAATPFGVWRIETGYPVDGEIRITAEAEGSCALRLRIPGWCRSCSLFVNGAAEKAEPGDWAVIDRRWSKGDEVRLVLDMNTYVIHAVPGRLEVCERHTALRRGPLVMARDLRLGEDVMLPARPAEKDGRADVELWQNDCFPSLVSLAVRDENGGVFHVADYSSCGKTLDMRSLMTCWLPEEDYLTPEKEEFAICGQAGYIGFNEDGTCSMKNRGALFRAEKTGAGFYRLVSEGRYLRCAGYVLGWAQEPGGEESEFRLISDRAGKRYIANKLTCRLVRPNFTDGQVLCSFEPYRWTLE